MRLLVGFLFLLFIGVISERIKQHNAQPLLNKTNITVVKTTYDIDTIVDKTTYDIDTIIKHNRQLAAHLVHMYSIIKQLHIDIDILNVKLSAIKADIKANTQLPLNQNSLLKNITFNASLCIDN